MAVAIGVGERRHMSSFFLNMFSFLVLLLLFVPLRDSVFPICGIFSLYNFFFPNKSVVTFMFVRMFACLLVSFPLYNLVTLSHFFFKCPIPFNNIKEKSASENKVIKFIKVQTRLLS